MPQICQDCGLWKCPGCKQCKTIDDYYKSSNPNSQCGLRPRCKVCTIVITPEERQHRIKIGKKYYRSKKAKARRKTDRFKRMQHQWYLNYLKNGGREVRKRYQQTEQVKKKHNKLVRKQYGTVKSKVRIAVTRAVLRNLLPHPETLNCCYCTENAQQYHHPLEYKWKFRFYIIPVCTSCHGKIHSKYTMQRPSLINFAED